MHVPYLLSGFNSFIQSLIGPLLIGYLEPESKNDEHGDTNGYLNNNIIPNALAKNGTAGLSAGELSMPPPPRPAGSSRQQIPSLLSSKRDEDDAVVDLNPWEEKK